VAQKTSGEGHQGQEREEGRRAFPFLEKMLILTEGQRLSVILLREKERGKKG